MAFPRLTFYTATSASQFRRVQPDTGNAPADGIFLAFVLKILAMGKRRAQVSDDEDDLQYPSDHSGDEEAPPPKKSKKPTPKVSAYIYW